MGADSAHHRGRVAIDERQQDASGPARLTPLALPEGMRTRRQNAGQLERGTMAIASMSTFARSGNTCARVITG